MDKYKFQRPWFNREPGSLVDESELRLGIIRTLVSMNVLVKVEDVKLDSKKNVKPAGDGSKPRGSKGPSKGSRKRTRRTDKPAD